MLLVNLVPNLFAVQRIAFFGGNVHILYVSEIVQDSMLLLLCGFPLSTPFYTVFLP